MSVSTVAETNEETSIEQKISTLETPWRDPEVLEYLYHSREMSLSEVGSEVGCSYDTVQRWMARHGLERRDKEDVSGPPRLGRATYDVSPDGYERWVVGPDSTTVRIHQLLAISDGVDPHRVFSDDTEVHHRAGDGMMNLGGGYVEVLSRGDHTKTHAAGDWTEKNGIPVLKTKTGDNQ